MNPTAGKKKADHSGDSGWWAWMTALFVNTDSTKSPPGGGEHSDPVPADASIDAGGDDGSGGGDGGGGGD